MVWTRLRQYRNTDDRRGGKSDPGNISTCTQDDASACLCPVPDLLLSIVFLRQQTSSTIVASDCSARSSSQLASFWSYRGIGQLSLGRYSHLCSTIGSPSGHDGAAIVEVYGAVDLLKDSVIDYFPARLTVDSCGEASSRLENRKNPLAACSKGMKE